MKRRDSLDETAMVRLCVSHFAHTVTVGKVGEGERLGDGAGRAQQYSLSHHAVQDRKQTARCVVQTMDQQPQSKMQQTPLSLPAVDAGVAEGDADASGGGVGTRSVVVDSGTNSGWMLNE